MGQGGQAPAHVLLFSVPAQGHVNPMLKLAELLSLAGLHVTFLNTDFIHDRLLRYTNVQARLSGHPGFQFKTISDGLPADQPQSVDFLMEIHDSLSSKTKQLLREMLVSNQFNLTSRPPVTCIIVDTVIGGVTSDVANELRIPVIHFQVISACSIWITFCVPDISEAGELPIKGNDDIDRLITTVPGMESFLRCRDLPSSCRDSDLCKRVLHFLVTEFRRTPQAHGLILNAFEDLEGPVLSQMCIHCPKVYTVGPRHRRKLSMPGTVEMRQSISSLPGLFDIYT